MSNKLSPPMNLCTSSLYFVVRVQCRRKESSRSLSRLLMSFLYNLSHAVYANVTDNDTVVRRVYIMLRFNVQSKADRRQLTVKLVIVGSRINAGL